MSDPRSITQPRPRIWQFDRGPALEPDRGQRAALEALAGLKAAKHAAAVIACVQDGLIVCDQKGTIADVNDRFCVMTGFTRADLVGRRRALPFWSPSVRAASEQAIATALENAARAQTLDAGEIELTCRRRSGEEFAAVVHLSRLINVSGDEIGWIATFRDPTAIAGTQQVSLETAERLRDALAFETALSRVATSALEQPLGAFLQTAADELRRVAPQTTVLICRRTRSRAWVVASAGERALPAGTSVMEARDPAMPGDAFSHELSWPGPAGGLPIDLRSAVVRGTPIVVDGVKWGLLAMADVSPGDEADRRLTRVASLLASAVTAERARTALVESMTRDPLTGLVSRRGFDERLASESARARRHGSVFSLAVLSLPQPQVADAAGGEGTLVEFARLMSQFARSSDVLARIGESTFALLLAETDALGAWTAIERARRELGSRSKGRISLLAGVCDSLRADNNPRRLLRLATTALRSAHLDTGGSVCLAFAERG